MVSTWPLFFISSCWCCCCCTGCVCLSFARCSVCRCQPPTSDASRQRACTWSSGNIENRSSAIVPSRHQQQRPRDNSREITFISENWIKAPTRFDALTCRHATHGFRPFFFLHRCFSLCFSHRFALFFSYYAFFLFLSSFCHFENAAVDIYIYLRISYNISWTEKHSLSLEVLTSNWKLNENFVTAENQGEFISIKIAFQKAHTYNFHMKSHWMSRSLFTHTSVHPCVKFVLSKLNSMHKMKCRFFSRKLSVWTNCCFFPRSANNSEITGELA